MDEILSIIASKSIIGFKVPFNFNSKGNTKNPKKRNIAAFIDIPPLK